MSYPRPSLTKVMDDESHNQEFDDPLASDGSDFEEIAIVEGDDIFSDDDSFFLTHNNWNSKLKDMRRGWNNRANALGTDETIIVDAENDLNNISSWRSSRHTSCADWDNPLGCCIMYWFFFVNGLLSQPKFPYSWAYLIQVSREPARALARVIDVYEIRWFNVVQAT